MKTRENTGSLIFGTPNSDFIYDFKSIVSQEKPITFGTVYVVTPVDTILLRISATNDLL